MILAALTETSRDRPELRKNIALALCPEQNVSGFVVVGRLFFPPSKPALHATSATA